MRTIQLLFAMFFCIVVSTCTEDANTDKYSAQGSYTWDSETGSLTMNWTSSDFPCDEGPLLGRVTSMTGVIITPTTMEWTGDGAMTWTRSGGTAGEILGTWKAQGQNGSSLTATFYVDGSITITGNVNCSGEAHSAGGTYVWNSGTAMIIWNWTSSDFICNGPDTGADTTTDVTINSTTMVWGGEEQMTWNRPNGVQNVIVGTWTAENSNGNSYTITFTAEGNVTVNGLILNCDNSKVLPTSGANNWNSACKQ